MNCALETCLKHLDSRIDWPAENLFQDNFNFDYFFYRTTVALHTIKYHIFLMSYSQQHEYGVCINF